MPDSATTRRLVQSISEHVTLEVSNENTGYRVDQFLAAHLGHMTRSHIQKLTKDGRVTIDTKLARASTTVHTGNIVRLELPPAVPAKPKAEALPIDVVYEDSDVIVVNKPAGMVVHPAAGHPDGTLVNALIHHVSDLSGIGGELRPGIVHRLDRGTSGLIVIAKHDQAHANLARQFKNRKYLRLVDCRGSAASSVTLVTGIVSRETSNSYCRYCRCASFKDLFGLKIWLESRLAF